MMADGSSRGGGDQIWRYIAFLCLAHDPVPRNKEQALEPGDRTCASISISAASAVSAISAVLLLLRLLAVGRKRRGSSAVSVGLFFFFLGMSGSAKKLNSTIEEGVVLLKRYRAGPKLAPRPRRSWRQIGERNKKAEERHGRVGSQKKKKKKKKTKKSKKYQKPEGRAGWSQGMHVSLAR